MKPQFVDVVLVGAAILAASALFWTIIDAWRTSRTSKRLNNEWRARAAAEERHQAAVDQQLATPLPYDPDLDPDPEGGLDLTKIVVHHEPSHWGGYNWGATYNDKGEVIFTKTPTASLRSEA